MTQLGIQRLKNTLEDLEHHQRPTAVKDVSEAVQKGDLSENAEYQEAKMRLARIDGRIFSLKERIKNAVVIPDAGTSGKIQLGSTVLLYVNGHQREYQIVGPSETNPTKGRISHLSPLGAALLGRVAGETVAMNDAEYQIVEVT